MGKYKVIIFDLDGTLIDSSVDIFRSTNVALQRLGYPALTLEQVIHFIGSGVEQLVGGAMGGPSKDVIEKAADYFREHYRDHCIVDTTWYPSVEEALSSLRKSHQLAILTNKPQDLTHIILDGLNSREWFGHIIGSESIFPKKPDPTGAHHIMNSLGVKPEETLYVGDSPVDLKTARSAGMDFALATYGFGFREEHRAAEGIHHHLTRFSDLINLA